jgi:hypothetical protein
MPDERVTVVITADSDNIRDLAYELRQDLDESIGVYIPFPKYDSNRRSSDLISPELIVALGSAGAFSGVFRLLLSYLTRHRDRIITVQRGNTKVTIKGHSQPQETALMATLFPDATFKARRRDEKGNRNGTS